MLVLLSNNILIVQHAQCGLQGLDLLLPSCNFVLQNTPLRKLMKREALVIDQVLLYGTGITHYNDGDHHHHYNDNEIDDKDKNNDNLT